MYFTYQEAKDLLKLFGEDPEVEIVVIRVAEGEPSHSGPGLYAYYDEYPDEGSFLLGNGRRAGAEKAPKCCADMKPDPLGAENFATESVTQPDIEFCPNCGTAI